MKTLKKISVTVERSTVDNRSIVKTLVNGIHVMTTETYVEYFKTFRQGAYSKLRDRSKKAFKSTWNREGLISLLGAEVVSHIDWKFRSKEPKIFRNFYPDLNTGFSGKSFNTREVRETIQKFLAVSYAEKADKMIAALNSSGITELKGENLAEYNAEASVS